MCSGQTSSPNMTEIAFIWRGILKKSPMYDLYDSYISECGECGETLTGTSCLSYILNETLAGTLCFSHWSVSIGTSFVTCFAANQRNLITNCVKRISYKLNWTKD